MTAFGTLVVAEAFSKLLHPFAPAAETMGVVGLLAFAGNALCFALLFRHRADELNMRSTWRCSRNDLVANVSVLAAAVAVAASGSMWPDVVVGLAIAALFLPTAAGVLRESSTALGRLSEANRVATR
jgi:Co/Zn/Cd efflux system component